MLIRSCEVGLKKSPIRTKALRSRLRKDLWCQALWHDKKAPGCMTLRAQADLNEARCQN